MTRRALAFLLLCGAMPLARPGRAAAPDHAVVPGFERLYAAGKADAVKGGLLLLGELSCTSCHAGADKSVGRKQAPVLDNVGSRVRLGHLRQFLSDPQKTKPGTAM